MLPRKLSCRGDAAGMDTWMAGWADVHEAGYPDKTLRPTARPRLTHVGARVTLLKPGLARGGLCVPAVKAARRPNHCACALPEWLRAVS